MLIRPFLVCAASLALLAQDAVRPSFEVASVKLSAPLEGEGASKEMRERLMDMVAAQTSSSGIRMVDKGRISLKRQTLALLIAGAYSTQADQVEGPPWIREARFDVDAKLPDGALPAAVPKMMQTLLAERFALRVHQEDRELAGYALAVAKGGPKLAPAAAPGDAPAPVDMDAMKAQMQAQANKAMAERKAEMMAGGVSGGGSSSRWTDPHMTMEQLAARLTALLHKPVIEATGLSGKYNVTVFVQRPADEEIDSAAERALAPLGLKLQTRKVPAKIVVVESATRTPTEN